MAYIGNDPFLSSQRQVTDFTATAGQDTFTPAGGYQLGYVDVYQNGILLVNGTDYTASNGTTVVLTEAASADDSIKLVTYVPRGLTDGYTKAEADALINAIPEATPTQVSDQDNTSTGYFDLPSGTTAQRPASPNTGYIRFNTTTNLSEYYDGTNWKSIDAPPIVNSISPSVISDEDNSVDITVSGSLFTSGATVKAIGADNSEISAATVVYNNSGQIVATFDGTQFLDAQEDYSIRVTNPSGLSSTLSSVLSVNVAPVFTQPSGSLGTIEDSDRSGVSISAGATDADNDLLTFSLGASPYDSLPSGLVLNTSTGAITGTADRVTADTLTEFDLNVSDGTVQKTRRYSISVNRPLYFAEALAGITNGDGNNLASANVSPWILIDPYDPNSYSGSGTTVNSVGAYTNKLTGTITGMNFVSDGPQSYFQHAGTGISDISFGTTPTGMTNAADDNWIYVGWHYITTNPSGSGGQIWVINDGDWSPYSQVGVRYGQGSSTTWKIHAGSTINFYGGGLRSDLTGNQWLFIAVGVHLSGALVVADGLPGSANLNVYVDNTNSPSTNNAANLPLTLGSRPDSRNGTAERSTNGYGIGPAAFWTKQSGIAFTSDRTEYEELFQQIFDATKGRYL